MECSVHQSTLTSYRLLPPRARYIWDIYMDWGLRLPTLRRSHAPLLVDGELVVGGGSTMLCAAAGLER